MQFNVGDMFLEPISNNPGVIVEIDREYNTIEWLKPDPNSVMYEKNRGMPYKNYLSKYDLIEYVASGMLQYFPVVK